MKLDTISQPHFTCQDIKKTQQFFKLKVSNQRLSHKHSYKINKRAPIFTDDHHNIEAEVLRGSKL